MADIITIIQASLGIFNLENIITPSKITNSLLIIVLRFIPTGFVSQSPRSSPTPVVHKSRSWATKK